MSAGDRLCAVQGIGAEPSIVDLRPDEAALGALAARLGIPAVLSLTCRFRLQRDRGNRVLGTCAIEARVVQEDVDTLDEFETDIHETAMLRFVPEAMLTNALDPDDPVDEVGYEGGRIDLAEAMAQQLALALDPYPRRGAAADLRRPI